MWMRGYYWQYEFERERALDDMQAALCHQKTVAPDWEGRSWLARIPLFTNGKIVEVYPGFEVFVGEDYWMRTTWLAIPGPGVPGCLLVAIGGCRELNLALAECRVKRYLSANEIGWQEYGSGEILY